MKQDMVNDFLTKTKKVITYADEKMSYVEIRPRIICKTGFSMSVQASHTHYCAPRDDDGPYFQVEVGYPNMRPPKEWEQYYDGKWQKTEGIVGWLFRLWETKHSIWYAFKQGLTTKMGWWYFGSLTSIKDNATEGVYGYVPIDLVKKQINLHKGIKTFAKQQKNKD